MRYAITLEGDSPDDETFTQATRHAECVFLADVFYCVNVLRFISAEEWSAMRIHDPHNWDRECWGCFGWLDQSPLDPEGEAYKRKIAYEMSFLHD